MCPRGEAFTQRESIAIAKITRPKLTGVYERKRLFKLLDQSLNKPVTWISGPAGSGKTTLVASWLDSRKLPCIWYQVDEGDTDIASLFYYMGLAAKKAAPRYKRSLPLLTPEYSLGIPTFTRRYFENLCNRLKPPHVVVFDNYQEVPEKSPFHEMMQHGLSSIPSGVNVIVISRTDPPPVFTGMLAKSNIRLVGWSELKLTPDESKGIVRVQGIDDPRCKLSSWMHEKTHGWAGGLILLTRAVRMENIGPEAIEGFSTEKIFDYFANELFDRADASMQEFLLKTAFVPGLTVRLAADLTGNKAAGQILSELNRRNYFTEKRQQKELTYQYHQLFREFLLTRAKNALSLQTITQIRRKAAKLLESSGQAEDAAEIYRESGDSRSLITLILSRAQPLVMQGRSAVLEKWLMAIPAEVVDKTPSLLYWKGVCRLPFNPREGQDCFERAFQQFKAARDRAGTYLAWVGVVEAVEFAFEDMHQLDRWIDMLPALMRKYKGFPSKEIEVKVAAALFPALVMRQPLHRDFDTWLKKALAIQDLNLKTNLLFHLAYYYIRQGDTLQAERVLNSLHEMAKSGDVGPLGLILIKLAELFFDCFSGFFDRGLGSVREGLKIAEQSGVRVLDTILLGSGAFGAFNCGDLSSAAKMIDTIAPLAERLRPWDKCLYHYAVATQAYLLGDLQKARAHIEVALNYSDQVGHETPKVWCLNSYALILHDLGEYENANRVLAQTNDINRDIKSHLMTFHFYFTKAYFALNRSQGQILLSCLKKALAIGKEIRLFGFCYVTWHPSAMSILYALALEHGIEVEYVRELIRKRKLSPPVVSDIAKLPSAPSAEGQMARFSTREWIWTEKWPWPVKIFTFGGFQLLVDDKPLVFSGKVQKKPLELLKALIAFGSVDVPEDRVSEALWPDADGDLAHKSVENNIGRLRRLLGIDQAIVLREGRITIDSRHCWVDVFAFEQGLENAEPGMRSEEPLKQKSVSLLDKAAGLYRGDFLAGEDRHEWAIHRREALKSKFLKALNHLAGHCETEGNTEKAVEYYRKGTEIDALAEDFYRNLMLCYGKLGREAEAVRVYRRCKEALASGLGVEPSAATQDIYRQLTTRKK